MNHELTLWDILHLPLFKILSSNVARKAPSGVWWKQQRKRFVSQKNQAKINYKAIKIDKLEKDATSFPGSLILRPLFPLSLLEGGKMRDPGNEVVIDGDPSQNTFSARFTCPLIPLTVRIVAPSNFATSKAELNMPWTKETITSSQWRKMIKKKVMGRKDKNQFPNTTERYINQVITLINAVFLNIFIGVPVNLSFLTSSTDLSKSNTVPVAEIRKSAWKWKHK